MGNRSLTVAAPYEAHACKLSRDRQGAIARLLVALCLTAAALLGAAPVAGEWPQFRGNPQLTGVAAGGVPANLKLLWTYDAGESIEIGRAHV